MEAHIRQYGSSRFSGLHPSKDVKACLSIQLLDKIDEIVDEDQAPSRSYVIREAVRKYLKESERK